MTSERMPIYLDYNATTPIAPEVRTAMQPYLSTEFGNPSSDHIYGRRAAAAVDEARARLAALLGCATDEIVFTSGGSESDNHAIVGRVWASPQAEPHIITSVIEHPAVLTTCRFLERHGARVTYLPVDGTGMVDPDAVRRAITPATVLVTIMHANNEIGTIQPIAAIAAVCREAGVPFHTDAAQSVGKIPTRVDELGVDLLTVAGHKLYAPKGIGALYVRRGTALEPLIHGAGHEGGRRAGTENVAYMVGLGVAADLAGRMLTTEPVRQTGLRDALWERLVELAADVALNGHPSERLPNTLNVRFAGIDGNALLEATPEIAAATGSACHAGQTDPSPVLLALGVPAAEAVGAVRLSLGRPTTATEVAAAADLLGNSARRLREGA